MMAKNAHQVPSASFFFYAFAQQLINFFSRFFKILKLTVSSLCIFFERGRVNWFSRPPIPF